MDAPFNVVPEDEVRLTKSAYEAQRQETTAVIAECVVLRSKHLELEDKLLEERALSLKLATKVDDLRRANEELQLAVVAASNKPSLEDVLINYLIGMLAAPEVENMINEHVEKQLQQIFDGKIGLELIESVIEERGVHGVVEKAVEEALEDLRITFRGR